MCELNVNFILFLADKSIANAKFISFMRIIEKYDIL